MGYRITGFIDGWNFVGILISQLVPSNPVDLLNPVQK